MNYNIVEEQRRTTKIDLEAEIRKRRTDIHSDIMKRKLLYAHKKVEPSRLNKQTL